MPSLSKPLPENPLVDLLDEDETMSGQKFCCISFLSPENIIKNRELFLFQEFLKKFDFTKSMEKYEQFLQFIIFKYNLEQESVTNDLKSFLSEEKSNLLKTTIEDEFKNFVDANEEHLEQMFNEQHSFKTSVRGIKVRGSFNSQEEAEQKCKMLREIDANHDIFVGPVGTWMPWEPEAYKTGKVEHLNDELNKLMHGKVENEKNAKVEFEKRIREAKVKAMEDNQKLAEKTGNVLSQKMDENGNLINTLAVDYDSIPDENVILPEEMSEKSGANLNNMSANIRQELFESNNITKPQSPNKSTRKSPSIDEITMTEIPKLDKKD
jgi:hypothetical protein